MKRFTYALLALLLVGCSSKQKYKIVHPTQENLSLGSKGYEIKASKSDLDKNESDSDTLISVHRKMHKISSIGTSNSSQNEIFGHIEDTFIDSLHRVYLLDSRKQLIEVFSQKGEYITSLGEKGKGPGEFEYAHSITNYKDRYLLISNGYRIEIYDISSKKIKFLKTLHLKIWAHSLCIYRNKLFIHNNRLWDKSDNFAKKVKNDENIPMIQAYNFPSMKPAFSFGRSYRSNNPSVVDRMTSGNLSCNRATSTIIFIFNNLPIIQGYSAKNGKLRWQSRIDNLNFPDFIEKNENGKTTLTYQIPESHIMDQFSIPISFRNTYNIIQVHRSIIPTPSREGKSITLTFLLNTSNGKGNYISKEIPNISSLRDHLVATISSNFVVSNLYKLGS